MNKKPPSGSGSFQEFRRTYVRPEPTPVKNAMQAEAICPVCAEIFPPGSVSKDFPTCPECYSEAIEVEVQPLGSFMASKTVRELEDMLTRWEATQGFRPEYKKLKADRLRHLIHLKLNGR